MVTKIARQLYKNVVGIPELRKAIAFAIFMKNHHRHSVYKDWSYRELARISGLSPTTCKKRIDTLVQMQLARRERRKGHTYLRFLKIRQGAVLITRRGRKFLYQPKLANVTIINGETIKEIERGLMASFIVEDTKRKDYVQHLVSLANSPGKHDKLKSVKHAKRVCNKRGYNMAFEKGGLSYRGISRNLKCSPNTVKEVIALGESREIFVAGRRPWVHYAYTRDNAAWFALPFYQDETGLPLFATRNNIWYKPALVFHVCQTL